MRKQLILLPLALGLAKAAAAFNPVPMPLTVGWTNGSEAFDYTNALYWTNSVVPTNVEVWQMFWGIRENFNLVSNEFATVEATLAGLPDAQTNSVLNSPSVATFTTNVFSSPFGVTNALWSGTNFASIDYTYYNSPNQFTNKPAILWSTNGGSTWNVTPPTPTCGAMRLALTDYTHAQNLPLALYPPIPIDSVVSNVVVWTLARPDLLGRTNDLSGQVVRVDTPAMRYQPANKGYVDDVAASINLQNVQTDIALNGHALNLDPAWGVFGTGQQQLHVNFLGIDALTITQPTPTASFSNAVASISQVTNVVVKVATNSPGASASMRLKVSHYLLPLEWNYLSTAPTNSGTNWQFTFQKPWPDSGFVMALAPSPDPSVTTLAGVLQLAPITTITSNSTTWGQVNLLATDGTNILHAYGTNQWERLVTQRTW